MEGERREKKEKNLAPVRCQAIPILNFLCVCISLYAPVFLKYLQGCVSTGGPISDEET